MAGWPPMLQKTTTITRLISAAIELHEGARVGLIAELGVNTERFDYWHAGTLDMPADEFLKLADILLRLQAARNEQHRAQLAALKKDL